MKHLTLAALCLLATVFTFSCKTQKSTGDVNASKGSLKGNWVVTDISYEGIPRGAKVTVFDQAPAACFKGSQWTFPNNYNGSYTLTSTDNGCSPATQSIVWSFDKNMFQFKKVYSGEKAKNVTEGYRLEISSLSGNQMVWRAPVDFEGKTVYIVYTLQKS
jgi:hypothetical protein